MTEAPDVALGVRVLRERLGCGRVLYGDLEHGRTFVVEAESPAEDVLLGVGRWELAAWWPAEARAEFERGVPIVCGDVTTEPRIPADARDAYVDWGVAAFVNAPLVEDGALVAVVVVQDRVRREWTAEEVAVVVRTAGAVRGGLP